jgi:hydrogenase maturation protease
MHFVRNSLPQIKSRRKMTMVAVIGIGQSLRGDDAAGLEAVRQWQEKFPETANSPKVRVETCELPGLTLLDMIEDVDAAILVDAVQSSAIPGNIYRLTENDLATFTSDAKSAHGWGVAETLGMGRQLGKAHIPIRLIGIEAEQMILGAGMSRAVQDSLPAVCRVIQEEVESLIGK